MVNKICARVLYIVFLLSVVWGLYAQNPAVDIKIRLAQSYEQSGDFEAAVKLYEEAYKKDSSSFVILDGLKRNYLQLKRYDNAIAVMQLWLQRMPNDLSILAQLGSTYILKSDEKKASDAWERAIAIDPKHETTYRIVGNSIVQSRLFDRAIELYKRGQTACGNPNLFTADIAYLYSIMLNYTEATREYLKMIRQNPAQIGLAQSRIAGYTERAEGLSATTRVVEDAAKAESDNISFQQLLAWLYLEGKHFDKAYSVYKFIDEKTKAGGHELFNFADRALREKAYTAAANAYKEIMNLYPKFDQMAFVKFGYARTIEESDELNDTLKLFGAQNPFTKQPEPVAKPLFTGAIEAYQQVIAEFPNTELAARSLLRIAVVKEEKYFDLVGSRSALETLVKNYSRFPAASAEGNLRLGDVYLAMGNLKMAENLYKMLDAVSLAFKELKEKAMFKLAELDYFNENFQDALTKLDALAANTSSDAANDALSLKIFIQENLKPTDAALKEYAKADLLRRQYKLPEALQQFESIVKWYPKTDIIDETLISIGDILTQMNRYEDAVTSYKRIATDYPESIYIDRTLMKVGQVYQFGLKDKVKAIETYQQLLEKYPNSIFISEARRRIRELRGDSI